MIGRRRDREPASLESGLAARRRSGVLEREVLSAVRDQGTATVGQVQQALGGTLAYTTVMTILSRLDRKGLVTHRKIGRAYVYAPGVAHSDLTARQMLALLDGADRTSVLASFITGLPPGDEAALQALLTRPAREA